jgi:hypothetical protein
MKWPYYRQYGSFGGDHTPLAEVSVLPTILELDSVPAGRMSLVHGSSVIWQIGSC